MAIMNTSDPMKIPYAPPDIKMKEFIIGLSNMSLSVRAMEEYIKKAKEAGYEKIIFVSMALQYSEFVINL